MLGGRHVHLARGVAQSTEIWSRRVVICFWVFFSMSQRNLLQSFVVGNAFYISEEQAVNTPSRQDGVNAATEKSLRSYACELMQEAAILL